MKIEISPQRRAWLEREIAGNGRGSPAELVEAALRAYELHLSELRRDITEADEAIQAGKEISETAEEFLARMRTKTPSAA